MSPGSEREQRSAASYAALADFYDQLFRRQHALWRRVRRDLLGRLPFRPASVCDLGCGTGSAALEFARRGVRVFAVDRSAAMCRAARRKARKERLAVRVIRADMRSFCLPAKVDLVLCSFHALNHLFHEKDFRKALQQVRRVLRPGGYFFFDCAHAAMYQSAAAANSSADSGDFFLVRGYEFDAARQRARFEATWFVRRGARWQRFDDSIPQRAWPDAKVRAMLRAEGFQLKAARDATRYLQGAGPRPARGCVTFYLAHAIE